MPILSSKLTPEHKHGFSYRDGSLCSVISHKEMHKIEKTYLWKPWQVFPVLDRQINRWRTVTLGLFRSSFKFWFGVGTYVSWRVYTLLLCLKFVSFKTGSTLQKHETREASLVKVRVTQANSTVTKGSQVNLSTSYKLFYNVDHSVAKFNKHEPKYTIETKNEAVEVVKF